MAIEAKRGCGFRKIHGLYMVADGLSAACDRLPIEIGACPVCNSGLHFTRGMTQINARKLWGIHTPCQDPEEIKVQCTCCTPPEAPSYIMGVGVKFYPTPQDFILEGIAQGVSKRIAAIPKNFKLGETWIYLVHPHAVILKTATVTAKTHHIFAKCKTCKGAGYSKDAANKPCDDCNGTGFDNSKPQMLDTGRYKPGVFASFKPQRIEKLIWQSEATEENLKDLEKRGITPVIVPDGDKDHK